LSLNTTAPAAVVQPRGGTVRETLQQNLAAEPSALVRALRRLAQAMHGKRRALLSLERRTMADPRVRCFAALSGYVVEQFERHYGIGPERIRLIPNAVDAPAMGEADRASRREAVRSQLGLNEATVAYLFSAYNPKLKGAYPLLEAWAKVRGEQCEAVLVMTGRITPKLRRRAERLGVSGSIRWVGATEAMAGLYCAADVLVHPTFYDPASRVVIEALRYGVPAITTRFNGAADLLLGPDTTWRGWVVARPDDVEALARAMAELADPDARAACRGAMAGIEDELDFDRYVDRLEAVLREATA
jgi:UDP-glucose:(heptosyl)LPS alpha-1,3-glucosyltransferase